MVGALIAMMKHEMTLGNKLKEQKQQRQNLVPRYHKVPWLPWAAPLCIWNTGKKYFSYIL